VKRRQVVCESGRQKVKDREDSKQRR
jgi:hypothetical protein